MTLIKVTKFVWVLWNDFWKKTDFSNLKKIYFICKWHRSTEAGHGVQELPQTREKQDLHSYFQTSLPESVNPCSIPDLKYQVMANTMHAKEKKQAGIP